MYEKCCIVVKMWQYLDEDEDALQELTDSVITKLERISDTEYEKPELVLDFDE